MRGAWAAACIILRSLEPVTLDTDRDSVCVCTSMYIGTDWSERSDRCDSGGGRAPKAPDWSARWRKPQEPWRSELQSEDLGDKGVRGWHIWHPGGGLLKFGLRQGKGGQEESLLTLGKLALTFYPGLQQVGKGLPSSLGRTIWIQLVAPSVNFKETSRNLDQIPGHPVAQSSAHWRLTAKVISVLLKH